MTKCPICQTETKKEYCSTCAWEFEYYFDELEPEFKAIYEERFRVYKAIYEKSILEPKIIVQEKKGIFSKLFGGDSTHLNQYNIENIQQEGAIVEIDGLMYQNQPFTKTYTWKEAKEYAQNLHFEGYDDWRLPTVAELKKLLTKKSFKNSKGDKHYIGKEFIENMPKLSWFWTSEEKDSSVACFLYFNDGDVHWLDKTRQLYALCVR